MTIRREIVHSICIMSSRNAILHLVDVYTVHLVGTEAGIQARQVLDLSHKLDIQLCTAVWEGGTFCIPRHQHAN